MGINKKVKYTESKRQMHLTFACLLKATNILMTFGTLVSGLYLYYQVKQFGEHVNNFKGDQVPVSIIAYSSTAMIVNCLQFIVLGLSKFPSMRANIISTYLLEFTVIMSVLIFLGMIVLGVNVTIILPKMGDRLKVGLEKSMDNYKGYDTAKTFVDDIQIEYQCCGFSDFKDWHKIRWHSEDWIEAESVPFSCCREDTLSPCLNYKGEMARSFLVKTTHDGFNRDGCAQKISKRIKQNIIKFSALLLVIQTVIEIISIPLVRWLATSLKRCVEKKKPTSTTMGYLFTMHPDCMLVESDVDLNRVLKLREALEKKKNKSMKEKKEKKEKIKKIKKTKTKPKPKSKSKPKPKSKSKKKKSKTVVDESDENKNTSNNISNNAYTQPFKHGYYDDQYSNKTSKYGSINQNQSWPSDSLTSDSQLQRRFHGSSTAYESYQSGSYVSSTLIRDTNTDGNTTTTGQYRVTGEESNGTSTHMTSRSEYDCDGSTNSSRFSETVDSVTDSETENESRGTSSYMISQCDYGQNTNANATVYSGTTEYSETVNESQGSSSYVTSQSEYDCDLNTNVNAAGYSTSTYITSQIGYDDGQYTNVKTTDFGETGNSSETEEISEGTSTYTIPRSEYDVNGNTNANATAYSDTEDIYLTETDSKDSDEDYSETESEDSEDSYGKSTYLESLSGYDNSHNTNANATVYSDTEEYSETEKQYEDSDESQIYDNSYTTNANATIYNDTEDYSETESDESDESDGKSTYLESQSGYDNSHNTNANATVYSDTEDYSETEKDYEDSDESQSVYANSHNTNDNATAYSEAGDYSETEREYYGTSTYLESQSGFDDNDNTNANITGYSETGDYSETERQYQGTSTYAETQSEYDQNTNTNAGRVGKAKGGDNISQTGSHTNLSTKSSVGKLSNKSSAGKLAKKSSAGKLAKKSSAGKLSNKSSVGKLSNKSSAGKLAKKSSAGKLSNKSSSGKLANKSSAGKLAKKSSAGKLATKSSAGKLATKSSAGKLSTASRRSKKKSGTNVSRTSKHSMAKKSRSRNKRRTRSRKRRKRKPSVLMGRQLSNISYTSADIGMADNSDAKSTSKTKMISRRRSRKRKSTRTMRNSKNSKEKGTHKPKNNKGAEKKQHGDTKDKKGHGLKDNEKKVDNDKKIQRKKSVDSGASYPNAFIGDKPPVSKRSSRSIDMSRKPSICLDKLSRKSSMSLDNLSRKSSISLDNLSRKSLMSLNNGPRNSTLSLDNLSRKSSINLDIKPSVTSTKSISNVLQRETILMSAEEYAKYAVTIGITVDDMPENLRAGGFIKEDRMPPTEGDDVQEAIFYESPKELQKLLAHFSGKDQKELDHLEYIQNKESRVKRKPGYAYRQLLMKDKE